MADSNGDPGPRWCKGGKDREWEPKGSAEDDDDPTGSADDADANDTTGDGDNRPRRGDDRTGDQSDRDENATIESGTTVDRSWGPDEGTGDGDESAGPDDWIEPAEGQDRPADGPTNGGDRTGTAGGGRTSQGGGRTGSASDRMAKAGGQPGANNDRTAARSEAARECTLMDSYTEMTEVLLPNDTNNLGRALGGVVLHWMDMCGAVAAMRFSRCQCVTAAMDHVDFISPIDIGEVAIIEAYVFNTGTTSIDVTVNVRAENPRTGQERETTTSYFTFVAVDESGAPTTVPNLACPTENQRVLREEALQGRQEQLRRIADRVE